MFLRDKFFLFFFVLVGVFPFVLNGMDDHDRAIKAAGGVWQEEEHCSKMRTLLRDLPAETRATLEQSALRNWTQRVAPGSRIVSVGTRASDLFRQPQEDDGENGEQSLAKLERDVFSQSLPPGMRLRRAGGFRGGGGRQEISPFKKNALKKFLDLQPRNLGSGLQLMGSYFQHHFSLGMPGWFAFESQSPRACKAFTAAVISELSEKFCELYQCAELDESKAEECLSQAIQHILKLDPAVPAENGKRFFRTCGVTLQGFFESVEKVRETAVRQTVAQQEEANVLPNGPSEQNVSEPRERCLELIEQRSQNEGRPTRGRLSVVVGPPSRAERRGQEQEEERRQRKRRRRMARKRERDRRDQEAQARSVSGSEAVDRVHSLEPEESLSQATQITGPAAEPSRNFSRSSRSMRRNRGRRGRGNKSGEQERLPASGPSSTSEVSIARDFDAAVVGRFGNEDAFANRFLKRFFEKRRFDEAKVQEFRETYPEAFRLYQNGLIAAAKKYFQENGGLNCPGFKNDFGALGFFYDVGYATDFVVQEAIEDQNRYREFNAGLELLRRPAEASTSNSVASEGGGEQAD